MGIFATPPLAIVDYPADKNHKGGPLINPRLIVLHATAGTNSREWLAKTSSGERLASIHRLISKDGTIYKIVPDDLIAFHVGFSMLGNDTNLNDNALGIELENLNSGTDPYPLAQLQSCAKQIVEWWGAYGYLPLLAHAQVDTRGKTDPRGFDWPLFYRLIDTYRLSLAPKIDPADLLTLRTAASAASAAALRVQEEVGVIQSWIELAGRAP